MSLEFLDARAGGQVPHGECVVGGGGANVAPVRGEAQLHDGARVALHHHDVLTLPVHIPYN